MVNIQNTKDHGYSTCANDCNNSDSAICPNDQKCPEKCGDDKDNNCNGEIDEGCKKEIELPMTVYQCANGVGDKKYDKTNENICDSGCSLAVMTMVLNYHLNKAGLPMVDVLELNRWLSENNGWDKNGRPKWWQLNKYPGIKETVVKYDESKHLNIDDKSGIDNAMLKAIVDEELKAGHPVILRVNGNSHSVVAIGITKAGDNITTYTIIDPGYNTEKKPQKTTLKERYNNNIDGIRVYLPRR